VKSSSVGTALKDINFVLMVPGTDRFGAKKEKEAEDEEDVDAVRGWYDDLPVDDLSTLRGITAEAAADETADEAAAEAADEEKMDCPDCRFLILETKADLLPDDLPTVNGVTFEAAAEDAVEEAVVEAAVKDVVVEAAVKDVVVEAAVDDVVLEEETDWPDRSFLIFLFKKLILFCLSWDALYSSSILTSSCVIAPFFLCFFLLISCHLLYWRKSSSSPIGKVAFSAAIWASKSSTPFLFRPTELLAALLLLLSTMIVYPMASEIVDRSRK